MASGAAIAPPTKSVITSAGLCHCLVPNHACCSIQVGQKLIEASNSMTGGYLDAAGTPSAALLNEFQFVDASIAAFVKELKKKHLYDSTLIVITAKWLKSSAEPDAAVTLLENNASPTGIALGQFYYGPSLTLNYNDPTVDPRSPDIIVTPNVGVTYSGSHAKQAEQGGFAHDDTKGSRMMTRTSSCCCPTRGFDAKTVKAAVGTAGSAYHPPVRGSRSFGPGRRSHRGNQRPSGGPAQVVVRKPGLNDSGRSFGSVRCLLVERHTIASERRHQALRCARSQPMGI